MSSIDTILAELIAIHNQCNTVILQMNELNIKFNALEKKVLENKATIDSHNSSITKLTTDLALTNSTVEGINQRVVKLEQAVFPNPPDPEPEPTQ
ncbi:hypothetical protein TRFO_42087 [Tritrichomonas foetus]|uniref:Uncharacterized protein n=1 Tax=Tritrichomonas foetus TaxID=1144522 RepID=A0A1J4KXT4_9EUKA|nr:hypothetical protein TRFO_42087 [Tritrichomonas foetus]|eukprot:OHT16065.1 hypothetical protein TRFO_42087 [Tritrichomonas foetus]